jgi:hypothetical protein
LKIPDTIFHYYLPDKQPFQNLYDLDKKKRAKIVSEMNDRKENGQSNRGFPEWYFEQREEAEKNLRKAYAERGGNPQRTSPHYFTLGRSISYEWIYKNEFRTVEIPIDLVKNDLCFSIGDTLWTFAKSRNPKVFFENKWYQGKMYSYKETCEIIKEIQVDLLDHDSINQHQIFCIETFIWSDEELNTLLKEIG